MRRAVDRLLASEFDGKDWTAEMNAVVDRVRSAGPMRSDEEVDAAVTARRVSKRAKAS